MLTRRHIRVKVMQSVYALQQSETKNMQKEEKFLLQSMDNMYNLYLSVLSLLIEIQKTAQEQFEISQKKYLGTAVDRNQLKKFVNNEVLQSLVANEALQEKITNGTVANWYLDDKYVQVIYQEILKSELFTEYCKEPLSTFKEDKFFVIDVFKEIIAPNEKLYEYIEDYKLTWVDDLPAINTLIIKQLRKLKKETEETHFTPKLFKDEDDKKFGISLLQKVLLNHEELQSYIADKTPNWDQDRIAELDNILLRMAICEFLKFPSIPVKVTINEYLEIAKEYSTPKSSIFINGVLDKLVKDFEATNTLNKIGRGLM